MPTKILLRKKVICLFLSSTQIFSPKMRIYIYNFSIMSMHLSFWKTLTSTQGRLGPMTQRAHGQPRENSQKTLPCHALPCPVFYISPYVFGPIGGDKNGRAGQGKAGQGRARQGRAGQGRARPLVSLRAPAGLCQCFESGPRRPCVLLNFRLWEII